MWGCPQSAWGHQSVVKAWQPGTLYQLIFLGIALMIWGVVGVGGYFGGGVWRLACSSSWAVF